MAELHRPTHAAHGHADNVEVHHEESDVNIRAIFGFGAGLDRRRAVVVQLVVWLLFVYLRRRAKPAASRPTYPLAAGQDDRLPPEPRLQTNPRQDLQRAARARGRRS